MRGAVPADFERVRELTLESKAHWGYDREFVRRWAEGLSFETERERWVAERDGEIVGWVAIVPPAERVVVLDDLWVDPGCMGQGIGSFLFGIAADRARELGAQRLEWGAEPNAVGFYEKVGGRKLRDQLSEWGRLVPWMGLDL